MKVKIQIITEIYLIICLISGYFYEVMTLYVCLIVHEVGHLIMIKAFKKDILLLEISPLGGILHIDKCQNDHNYKEFLIYLSGPVASLILYLAFRYFQVDEVWINSAFYIFILNILPILPLDGAKIIMSLKQYFITYRTLLKMMTILSLITCFILIFFFINNYNYVIILTFFVYLNLIRYKDIPYVYYDFLWYKHLHPNKRLKSKMVIIQDSLYNLFYKGYNHVFFNFKHFRQEDEVLKELLDK